MTFTFRKIGWKTTPFQKINRSGAFEDWMDLVIAGILAILGYFLFQAMFLGAAEHQDAFGLKQAENTESAWQGVDAVRWTYLESKGLFPDEADKAPIAGDGSSFHALRRLIEDISRGVLQQNRASTENQVSEKQGDTS